MVLGMQGGREVRERCLGWTGYLLTQVEVMLI